MAEFRIEPATVAHAVELAPRLRPADAAEVLASGGYAPLEALLESIKASDGAWAAYFAGELGCLFGVSAGPFLSFRAYPWLLTSDVVARYPKTFLRACREVLAGWADRFGMLEQAIDARYTVALRWAARVGFEVAPPAPFGVAGLPFCRITLRRSHV